MNRQVITDTAERVVFHFNKAHNTDPLNIPAWIVKCKGQTYQVHSMSSKVGFSTKETPDSAHTKASIQFKGKLSIIENTDGTKEAIIE